MFSKDLKRLLDEKYLEYNRILYRNRSDPDTEVFRGKRGHRNCRIPGSIISMGTTAHDYQEMQGVDAINGLCTS